MPKKTTTPQPTTSILVTRVVNTAGRAFNVVLVRTGDRYGQSNCLTHEAADPLVEFYDATYEDDDRFDKGRGQFVNRYYFTTLRDRKHVHVGLDLCGYETAWKLSADNVSDAIIAVDAALRGVPKDVVDRETRERQMFGCTVASIDEALADKEPRDVAMYAMGALSNAQELIRNRGYSSASEWYVLDRDANTLRQLMNIAKYAMDKAVSR